MPRLDTGKALDFISHQWDDSIVPELCEYIRIPCKSPMFDAAWQEHGYMDEAAEMLAAWCRGQSVDGMKVEIVRLDGRTPVVLVEVEGSAEGTVLLYGHLDKQPEFTGWREHLGPWEPVIEDGRLYGRGGADDGYAIFGSLTAIRALQEQGIPHARCVILIEGCEESGSYDLPYYVEHLSERIGEPGLVVCLDAECGNYDQLWCTTSLRGNHVGELTVRVLEEGVHSGGATGMVPDSFRILRRVLDRIEDPDTGEILLPALETEIPEARMQQIRDAAAVLDGDLAVKYPMVSGARMLSEDPEALLLENTWRAGLCVTGADGLPAVEDAGNVMRPETTVKLSFRLPPNCDPEAAGEAIREALESDPPYGVEVRYDPGSPMGGWDAPPVAGWLHEAMQAASQAYFGRDAVYLGMGGSIPFMGMLGRMFPEAQFLVTGVLGPQSNAHGPNEFLHIEKGKRLTACVASVLEAHASR